MARRADLHVHGGGSVYFLRPVTQCGASWVDEHIPSDAMRFAGAIVVEHRYICSIVAAAIAAGLEVR